MVTTSTESSPRSGIPDRYVLTKQVLRLPIKGRKRKKLLAAIAAFQDEGHEPSVRDLMARTKLCDEIEPFKKKIRFIDALLRLLAADGFLRIKWAPRRPAEPGPRPCNHYEVVLPEVEG